MWSQLRFRWSKKKLTFEQLQQERQAWGRGLTDTSRVIVQTASGSLSSIVVILTTQAVSVSWTLELQPENKRIYTVNVSCNIKESH